MFYRMNVNIEVVSFASIIPKLMKKQSYANILAKNMI